MRYIKMFVLAVLAIGLIFIALGNRETTEVQLVPDAFETLVGFNFRFSLPLFFILFGGVGVGLLIGYILEWLREHKHRKAVRTEHKQVVRLEREVDRLKAKQSEGKDDVLALLDS